MLLGRKIMIGILAAGMVTSAATVTIFALNDKGIIKLHQDELREYNAQFYSEGALVYETGKIKKGTAINYGYKDFPTKRRTPDGKVYQCIGWDITGEGLPDVVPTKIYGDFKANAVFIRLPAIEKLLMDPDLIAKLAELLQKLNVELTPEQVQKIMDWLMNLGIDWESIDMSVLEQLFNLLNIDLQQFLDMMGIDLEGLMAILARPMFKYTATKEGPYYFRTQSFGNTFKDNAWTKSDYYSTSNISNGSVNPLAYSTDKIAGSGLISSVNFNMTYVNKGDVYPVPCNELNNTQNLDSESYSLTSPTEIDPIEDYKYSSTYNTSALGFIPACTYAATILKMMSFSNDAITNDELIYREYAKSHYLEVEDKYRNLFSGIANENGITKDDTYNYLSQVLKYFSNFKFNYMMHAYPSNEDKILYFINTAHEGIGSHFADAATMFFRTLGVPARTVSGYVDIAETAMEERTVTGIQAHNWTEVYLDGIGWMTFDACLGDNVIPAEYSQYLMNSFDTISPDFGSEKITNLDIKVDPNKEYYVGDTFSKDDLTFTITTENGAEKVVSASELTYVSTPDLSTEGEKTITGVIIQDTDIITATTTIVVQPVVPVSLSLTSYNDEVMVGDTYSPYAEGFVTMNNGDVRPLSSFEGLVCDPVDTSEVGEQYVSIHVPGYEDVNQNVLVDVYGPDYMEIIDNKEVNSVRQGTEYDPDAVAIVYMTNGSMKYSYEIGGLDHTDIDTSTISTQYSEFSLNNFPEITQIVEVDVYGPTGLDLDETSSLISCNYGETYNPSLSGEVVLSNGDRENVNNFNIVHTPFDNKDIGTHEVTFYVEGHPEINQTVNVTVYGPEELIMDPYESSIHEVPIYGMYDPYETGEVLLTNGETVSLSNFDGVEHTSVDTSAIGLETSTFSLIGFPEITQDIDVLVVGPESISVDKTTNVTEVNVGSTYNPGYVTGTVTFNNGDEYPLQYFDYNYSYVDTSSVSTQEVTYSLTQYSYAKETFDVTVVGPVGLELIDSQALNEVLINGTYNPSPEGYVVFNNGAKEDLQNYGELIHTEIDTSVEGTQTATFTLVDYPELSCDVDVDVVVPEELVIVSSLNNAYLNYPYTPPENVAGYVIMSNGDSVPLNGLFDLSVDAGSLDTSTAGEKTVTYTLEGFPTVSDEVDVKVCAPVSIEGVSGGYTDYIMQYTSSSAAGWGNFYADVKYEDGTIKHEYRPDLIYTFPDTSEIGEQEISFTLPGYPDSTYEKDVYVYGPTGFTFDEGGVQDKYFQYDSFNPSNLSGTVTLSDGTSTWEVPLSNFPGIDPTDFDTSSVGTHDATFTLNGYPDATCSIPITVIDAPDTEIASITPYGTTSFEIPPGGNIDFSEASLQVTYEDGLVRYVDDSTGTFTLGEGAPDLSIPGEYHNVPIVYTEIINGEPSQIEFTIDVTVKNRSAIHLTTNGYRIDKEYDGNPIDVSSGTLMYIFQLDPESFDSINDNQHVVMMAVSPAPGASTSPLPGTDIDVMFMFYIESIPGGENIIYEYFDEENLELYINDELQTEGIDYACYTEDGYIRFICRFTIVSREISIHSYSGYVSSIEQLSLINGDANNLYVENLLPGHYIDLSKAKWTTPTTGSEFENTLDPSSIIIRDEYGNDVTEYYNITFTPGYVYIV